MQLDMKNLSKSRVKYRVDLSGDYYQCVAQKISQYFGVACNIIRNTCLENRTYKNVTEYCAQYIIILFV